MKRLILPVIILFSACFLNNVKAQTAVYLCTATGAFGYCHGYQNPNNCAYNMCVQYGGQTPISLLSTDSKGYGAIAVGTNSYGRRVVGASAGYSNSESAKQRAIRECIANGGENVTLYDSWRDN